VQGRHDAAAERITLLVIGSLLGSIPVAGVMLLKLTLLALAVSTNLTAAYRIVFTKNACSTMIKPSEDSAPLSSPKHFARIISSDALREVRPFVVLPTLLFLLFVSLVLLANSLVPETIGPEGFPGPSLRFDRVRD